MRDVKRHHSSVQTFCMVAVFAVFAILSVLLTLMGARVYKQVTQSSRYLPFGKTGMDRTT